MPSGNRSLKALCRAVTTGRQELPAFTPAGPVCFTCRQTLRLYSRTQRRRYASAAATAAVEASDSQDPPPSSSRPIKPSTATPAVRPTYQLHAGILLSRAPLLTRDLTPFEKAFYLYQRRLNERLALPFTRYFYIKQGTPADVDWKRKIRERLTPARDIGVYHAYGKEAWNDELLVGDETSEPQHQVEALLHDAETAETVGEEGLGAPPDFGREQTEQVKAELAVQQAEAEGQKVVKERPKDRITDADRAEDERSLNRLGWRSLYLLVKGKGGSWRFPSARLVGGESLRQGAERVMLQAAGPNMNTWIVGNAPVGHYAAEFAEPVHNAELGRHELGEKIFFMKGRIMTGQADLKENLLGLEDFKWLSKEEVKSHVDTKYFSMVANMMSER